MTIHRNSLHRLFSNYYYYYYYTNLTVQQEEILKLFACLNKFQFKQK